MKNSKALAAVILSALILNTFSAPVLAEAEPSEKEEVIYVMTDPSGKVNDIEAVNIFSGGSITDYGDYSAVRMMNTTDKITQNGGMVSFTSSADRVYYQGTVKKGELPWNISIGYFLDGKECSAEETAGKSGALEIHFSVSKNEKRSDGFYDDYALQASFTLDTELCKNIRADGATAANVGGSKQLTYTVLPGKGIDTVIKADVTDFEMDAVTINGVKLNMDVDIDSTAISEKINGLVSAIGKIDGGAAELCGGEGELYGATDTLNGKVGELYSGTGSLSKGAESLYSGLAAISSKNSDLTGAAYTAYEGLCTASAAALNSKLSSYGIDSVTLTPDTYSSVLGRLLEELGASDAYNKAYNAALDTVTRQTESHADELYLAYVQSQADSVYMSYAASRADELYSQVATQAVYGQLIEQGYTEQQAELFLQSAEGQITVARAVENMTDEQKALILQGAVERLTDEQKQQIITGAVNSLTDGQKSEIKDGYIRQMMASDEVAAQINSAVAAVNSAAMQVSELKGQLDGYGAFYAALTEYTSAVSAAASGAQSLKINMDSLYQNTGTLSLSAGKLNDAVYRLYEGSKELSDGTGELYGKTSNLDEQVNDEIDSVKSSICKSGTPTVSFISEKNTNVDSVQFVIKTAAIEKAEQAAESKNDEAPLTFWQKLLRLFGLY